MSERCEVAGAAVDRAPRDPRHVRLDRAGATVGAKHDVRNVGAVSADIEARAELMEGFRVWPGVRRRASKAESALTPGAAEQP